MQTHGINLLTLGKKASKCISPQMSNYFSKLLHEAEKKKGSVGKKREQDGDQNGCKKEREWTNTGKIYVTYRSDS